jgi:small subunit ribosomal protein S6
LKNYEGMFLVDSAAVTKDAEKVLGQIRTILGRHKAEIVNMARWAERKLAFEIKRQKRGTYMLCYFKASTDALPKIRRDCEISEGIIRALFVSHSGENTTITPFVEEERRPMMGGFGGGHRDGDGDRGRERGGERHEHTTAS